MNRRNAELVKWVVAPGGRVKGDPQEIGECISRLKNKAGEVPPAKIVSAARDPKSPLHREFTWDDTEAARLFRLEQARSLLRSIVVEVTEHDVVTYEPGWVNLRSGGQETRPYEDFDSVMRDPEKRAQLLLLVLSQFRALRQKYARLTELAKVYEALDKVAAEIHPKKK